MARLLQHLEEAVQEHPGDAIDRGISQASIAVSLKRIADSLERSQVAESELDRRERRLSEELALSISHSSKSVTNILMALLNLLIEKGLISPDDLKKMLDGFEGIFEAPEHLDDKAQYERELSIATANRLRRIFFPENTGA